MWSQGRPCISHTDPNGGKTVCSRPPPPPSGRKETFTHESAGPLKHSPAQKKACGYSRPLTWLCEGSLSGSEACSLTVLNPSRPLGSGFSILQPGVIHRDKYCYKLIKNRSDGNLGQNKFLMCLKLALRATMKKQEHEHLTLR